MPAITLAKTEVGPSRPSGHMLMGLQLCGLQHYWQSLNLGYFSAEYEAQHQACTVHYINPKDGTYGGIINRPGVAGALLQTASSVIKSWFVEIYSKHCQSQTGRARELKF